jgi:hypothetical protein
VRVLPGTSPRGVHSFALPPHAKGLLGGGWGGGLVGGGGELSVAPHSRCHEQERRAEEGEEKGGGEGLGGGGGGEGGHGLKRVSYIRDIRTNRSATAAVPPPLPVR